MRPYYEDGQITIYHGDCREVLPRLESVDHVVTDPPFSEDTHTGARSARHLGFSVGETDSSLITFQPLALDGLLEAFARIGEITQRWVISFIDWQHAAVLKNDPPVGLRFVRLGVWVKPNGAPQFTGDRPAQGWEAVAFLHADDAPLRWNGGGARAVWTQAKVQGAASMHPTQKPIALIEQILSQFTDLGDVVLDPFMGSGTTLRAAKNLGRKAIGIEIEERYCEIAVTRLAQTVLPLSYEGGTA